MVNLTKSGGGSSNSLKIYKSSAPPDVGKHGDVVLITEQNIPKSYTQPDEPSEKQIGDVWVVTGDGGVEITLGKQPKITYSLLGAQQWDGASWKKLDGFVWIESEWVQFSRKGIPISDLPNGTIIASDKLSMPYSQKLRICEQNHNGFPKKSTLVVTENVQIEMTGKPANGFKYDGSNIDTYLENDFYQFLSPLHAHILKTSIVLSDEVGDFTPYNIERNIFLASPFELGFNMNDLGTKIPYFSSNIERRATGVNSSYYTREYVYNLSNPSFKRITSVGGLDNQSVGGSGIRPFFCLKNNILVFPDPNPDGSYNLIL